jgi:ATP-dependent DNA helicase RecG
VSAPDPAFESPAVLAGVGPVRAERLAQAGLETVRDLMLLLPRRLETPGEQVSVAEALERVGSRVRVRGTVARPRFSRFGRRSTVRFSLEAEGAALDVLFFNQPWQRDHFSAGEEVTLSGDVGTGRRGPALVSPRRVDPSAESGRAGRPVYAGAEGIGSDLMGRLCRQAVERAAARLEEALPAAALARLALPSLPEAVGALHAPPSVPDYEAARRRVVLESLLPIQARVLARAAGSEAGDAFVIGVDEAADAELRARLPFVLTAGQGRVVADLRADLARATPMRRLLQGEVASGKTILGAYACMAAAAAGAQAAFLAPTELLAEQHFAGLRELLESAGVRTDLLCGSLRARRRRELLERLAAGTIDVLFGTHALFSPDVRYARLALAVIDEQHRFGVAQRARLMDKGRDVHVLLMTATPIPRTLALTLYGDLSISTLRELPAGRQRVRTRRWGKADGPRAERLLTQRLEAGERVFWVSPRIGDRDSPGAERAFERLKRSSLGRFGVELVHGRLGASERARRLERFKAGRSRLLVATTVIEVGVDVPEAAVMVVEDADRLGLAQLHQLRGRVGRGGGEAWCLLRGSDAASERLELLERCHDGFELAEEDLRRRGMGELSGLRQSGAVMEGLGADLDLLTAARDLLSDEPALLGAYASPRPPTAAAHAP